MAITDTLRGTLNFTYDFQLARIAGEGDLTGRDTLIGTLTQVFTNGAGANQATCMLSGNGTSTVAPITLSLADSVNPLSTFSDEVPSADPEGLKVRLLIIRNLDDTNFITVTPGGFPIGDIGTNLIYPGGWFIWMAPAGGNVINDGVDDEITLTADTGPCLAEVQVVYG